MHMTPPLRSFLELFMLSTILEQCASSGLPTLTRGQLADCMDCGRRSLQSLAFVETSTWPPPAPESAKLESSYPNKVFLHRAKTKRVTVVEDGFSRFRSREITLKFFDDPAFHKFRSGPVDGSWSETIANGDCACLFHPSGSAEIGPSGRRRPWSAISEALKHTFLFRLYYTEALEGNNVIPFSALLRDESFEALIQEQYKWKGKSAYLIKLILKKNKLRELFGNNRLTERILEKLRFSSRVEFVVVPAFGFSVVEERNIDRGRVVSEGTFADFTEVGPGIWLPVSYKNGRGLRVNFAYHSVNRPFPASVFEFHFPPGTSVVDDFSKKRYTTPYDWPTLLARVKDLVRYACYGGIVIDRVEMEAGECQIPKKPRVRGSSVGTENNLFSEWLQAKGKALSRQHSEEEEAGGEARSVLERAASIDPSELNCGLYSFLSTCAYFNLPLEQSLSAFTLLEKSPLDSVESVRKQKLNTKQEIRLGKLVRTLRSMGLYSIGLRGITLTMISRYIEDRKSVCLICAESSSERYHILPLLCTRMSSSNKRNFVFGVDFSQIFFWPPFESDYSPYLKGGERCILVSSNLEYIRNFITKIDAPVKVDDLLRPPKLRIETLDVPVSWREIPKTAGKQQEVVKRIAMRNDGKKDGVFLALRNLRGSCGCIKPKFSKEFIAPGEAGELICPISVKGWGKGMVTRFVFFETNDPKTPVVRVKFHGVLEKPPLEPGSPLLVFPTNLSLGSTSVLDRFRSRKVVVHVRTRKGTGLEDITADSTLARLTFRIERSAEDRAEIRLDLSKVADGAFSGKVSLKIVPEGKKREVVEIPISGKIVPDIAAEPAIVTLTA